MGRRPSEGLVVDAVPSPIDRRDGALAGMRAGPDSGVTTCIRSGQAGVEML